MFDALIASNAAAFNVPEYWIRAVIQAESSFNPDAYNPHDPTGAWGLMQLLYSTAQGLGYTGPPAGLFDPATNIYYGTKLLSQLRQRYGDDLAKVYSAYNSGSSTAYLTSSQVAANVKRVLSYASQFITEQPGVVGASALTLVGLFGLLYLMRKHK